MRLNHLDLQVTDVPAAAAFFARAFDLALASNGTSPALAILRDPTGFTLVLQRKQRPDDSYPAGFHLGFYVSSIDDVHAHHARLAALALPGLGDVVTNGRGTMFYVRGPDDLLIEVNCPRPR